MSRAAEELWERAYDEAFNEGCTAEECQRRAEQALEDAAGAAADYAYEQARDRALFRDGVA